MSRRQIISIFCLLYCAFICVPNIKRDLNIHFKGTGDGLSHQTVNCFHQDEFGFLWIGTKDGLNRFDGNEFEIFKPEKNDPYSISMNNILQICGNNEGMLFIRSQQGVVCHDMRLNRFSVLKDGEVAAISYAHGSLWLATGKEIFRYRNQDGYPELFYSFKGDDDILINNISVRNDSTVVAGTSKRGVFMIDTSGHLTRHIDVGAINSTYEDNNGNEWISTRDKGLVCLTSDGKLIHYRSNQSKGSSINHDNVRQVVEANDSILYIGTYAGLQTLNKRTGEFVDCEYSLNADAPEMRSITSMYYDASGTLWMGTFYQGIHYYNSANDTYRFYRSSTVSGRGLYSYILSSVAEDRTGRVWFGSEGGGLTYYDKETDKFYPVDKITGQKLSFNVVKSLYYDKDNDQLWVTSLHQGVNRVNLGNGRIDYVTGEIPGQGNTIDKAYNQVKILGRGNQNTILIAAKNGLLILDKNEMKLKHFPDSVLDSRYLSQVWDMAYDKSGNLWVANSFDLVRLDMRHNQTMRHSLRDISNSKTQHHINHLMSASDGRMWLGTSGAGIFVIDNDKNFGVTNYNSQNGLDNGFITGIAESPLDGSIYVTTNSGLYRFNRATGTFENYSTHNDFPLDNINDGGLFISSGGDVYICGLKGVVIIPADMRHNRLTDYKVYVKRIYVDNKEVRPLDDTGILEKSLLYGGELTLPSRYSSISFDIAANMPDNITGIQLEYKLEGFDNDYVKANGASVTYTHLNPGHYIFHIRGNQPNLMDGEIPMATYELTVEAPIYQRWWFIAIIISAILSVAAYIIRMVWIRKALHHSLETERREKEYIDKTNKAKLRLFTNVSHEFRTPLTIISSQLEILLMRKGINPEIYGRILDIYKSSQRMNNLVDEIIDIRKQEQGFLKLRIVKDDIVSIMRMICDSFRSYANLNGIEFNFISKVESLDLYIDRTQIEKVFYNLLSNAFKYTRPGGFVTVEITLAGCGKVTVAVINKGSGIDKDKIAHVFDRFWEDDSRIEVRSVSSSGIGLSVAKGIVEQHGGSIEVASDSDGITSFKVTLGIEDNKDATITEDTAVKEKETGMIGNTDQDITEIVKPDKNIKILIVEDNREMRDILKQVFGQIYDVYTATDGKEGLDLAVSLQPDIIVSDVMMPVMSGIEMCERLKNDLCTSHIPVVLLTARNKEEHALEGLQTGADDYISKPFNCKLLVARCNNIIQTRKLLQARFSGQEEARLEELPLNPLDKKLLANATAIVESYIDDYEFDIATFSREMCMSRTLLFTKLKSLTGQTPNDFITSVRLRKAAETLKNDPEALVADIAVRFGFSSSSYFIRRFKDNFNMTPSAYRKQTKD